MGEVMGFLLAAAFAIVVAPVARRAGAAAGFIDRGNDPTLNIHEASVPVLGGVVVLAAAASALAITEGTIPAAPFVAVGVTLAAGMIDDMVSLPAVARMLVLIVAGATLVVGDVRLEALGPLAAPGTIALVLACANGVNFLDGQDGLAAGVSGIAALGLAGVAVGSGGFGVDLGLALTGAVTGYLLWNRTPARMFLGNGGAYALGVCLAALAADASTETGWRGVLGAGLCLGLVAFELVSTVARRVHGRSGLARGDRMHSYDLLAGRTGDRNLVTALFWIVGATLAGTGVAASSIYLPAGAVLAGFAGVLALLAGIRLWGPSRLEANSQRSAAE